MKRRFTRSIGPAISVCLFVLALVLIHHELKVYHFRDIVHQIRQVPGAALLAAVGLTILNYLVLTVNDALALRYARRRLPYHQLAFASFIGYAFSSNATVVGGSAARYRIYSALGLSSGQIAETVLFCSYPVWLGFFLVTGTSFVLQPPAAPVGIPISNLGFQILGLACLAALGGYMAMILRRRPLVLGRWQLRVPAPALALGQLAVTSLDWLLAAAALYVLLPDQVRVSYPAFLGLFLLGQAAAMISHVPGGLGVFETVLLLALADSGGAPALTAALLLYRLIYYLLPLLAGSLLLALHEVLPPILSGRAVARLPLDSPD
jgi:uncharacterized membrane protein YbhN (UPF0104 family)